MIGACPKPVTRKLLLATQPLLLSLLEQRYLGRIAGGNCMAHSAPCLVGLRPSDHDLGRIVGGRTPADETLVATGWTTAEHADRVQLVDHLGDRHQVRHRAKRLPAKICVRSRDDDAPASARQGSHQRDDALIQELRFVDRDDVGHRIDLLSDLRGRVGRDRLDGATVVARNRIDTRVPGIEVGLEHLHPFPRDNRPPYAANELLALAAEHDAGNHFDPSTGLVEWSARSAHDRSRSLRGGPPRLDLSGGPPRRGAPGRPLGGAPRSRDPRSGRSLLAPADRSLSSLSRSPRTTTRRPRIIAPLTLAMTPAASASATSTRAWLSRRSILPT